MRPVQAEEEISACFGVTFFVRLSNSFRKLAVLNFNSVSIFYTFLKSAIRPLELAKPPNIAAKLREREKTITIKKSGYEVWSSSLNQPTGLNFSR